MTREVRLTGYLIEDYGSLEVTTSFTEFDTDGETYEVFNNGTENVYMGSDNSVLTTSGFPIPPNTSVFIRNKVYFIAGGTVDMRYVKASK